MAAEDGGGQWQRTTTARKIRQRTMMGKVGNRRQTMTALSIRDREDDVVFNGSHMVQLFVVSSMDIQLPQSTNLYLEVRYKERGHTPTLRS
jgi:hypothetical protein